MMKNKKLIFILIGVFCVFALITGIYSQFFLNNTNNNKQPNNENQNNNVIHKNQEQIKEQLTNLFTNEFINNEYDVSNIEKKKNEKDIVYSAYDVKQQETNYEIDIHLPVINIKGNVPTEFNQITQSIFANKASEIVNENHTEKIIYSVDYISYVNENILSVAIRSTLKQGNNPQRVIIQTYNYNLETGEKVEFQELLSEKNIILSDCQNKINEVIKKAQEEAKVLVQTGYTVYNRNLTDNMYQIENINNFFLGENGELYIIFAYGNQNLTAEMDIVLYE